MTETIDVKRDAYGVFSTQSRLSRILQEAYITGVILKNYTFSAGRGIKDIASITWRDCLTKENIWKSVAIGFIGTALSTSALIVTKQHYQENYIDSDGYRIGSISAEFNDACKQQSKNTQLFCLYALHAAKAGASPYAVIYKAYAETGGRDLQGMRHEKSNLPYYNGPGQTGYEQLIQYVSEHGKNIELYQYGKDSDPRVMALKSLFEDPRLSTQKGRQAIESDLLDGTVDYAETVITHLASDPEFMGQVIAEEIKKTFPELLLENLSYDPVLHVKQVQQRVGQFMLHNLAGPNGRNHFNYLAKHYPDIQMGDTKTLEEILPHVAKQLKAQELSPDFFTKVAEANQKSIFTPGLSTRFGDVPNLFNKYMLNRSYEALEEIIEGATGKTGQEILHIEGSTTAQSSDFYTTAPEKRATAPTVSLRPRLRPDIKETPRQENNTSAPTTSLRPRLRPTST